MDKGFKIFIVCWVLADIALLALGLYNRFP